MEEWINYKYVIVERGPLLHFKFDTAPPDRLDYV